MKKLKKTKGFTLLEIMVAIVIMGFFLTMTMTSYNDSLKKSKIANLKVNMSSFQTMLETYAASNDNMYPVNSSELKNNGIVYENGVYNPVGSYWRDFANPIDGKGSKGFSTGLTIPGSYMDIGTSLPTTSYAGVVGYNPSVESGKVTSIYYIYASDIKGWIKDDAAGGNILFVLTNSD